MRYSCRPGDTIVYQGHKYQAKGTHNQWTRVMLENGKSVDIKKLKVLSRTGGWVLIQKERRPA